MAVSTSDPYTADPTVPRKITPTGVVLDPLQAQGPDTAPSSQAVPQAAGTPAGTAASINQLPDGAGGAVAVPPPAMSPTLSPLSPGGPNINQIPNAPATIAPAGPAPVTSSAPSSLPGTSTFGADTNLIQTQVDPAASARLLNVQGLGDQALNSVLNGPDRFALAQSKYDTFAQNNASQFQHALHDATGQAAAHGQIGSGQLTNRYGDLTSQFQQADNASRSNFLNDALTGTIGDRLNNLGAAQSYGNSIYGQEASARNEVRGERGYQQSLAEQAIAQRIAQQQMEQGQQAQNFGEAATMYGLGMQGDPTNAYQNAATLASTEAGSNSGDVAALLRLFAQRQNPLPTGY